jgi:hypothetical protein
MKISNIKMKGIGHATHKEIYVTHKESKALHKKVADYILRHPEDSFAEISRTLGLSVPTLSVIANKHGIHRRKASNRYAADAAFYAKLEK